MVFWYFHNLTNSTEKAKGFWSIGKRPRAQKWFKTNSNNKGSHEAWFYTCGSGLEELQACSPTSNTIKRPKLKVYGIQDIEAYKKNLRLRYQEERKKSKKDSSENIHTHVSIPEAPNDRESGAHHTPLDPLLEIESPLRGKRDDHPPEDDRVVKKLRVGNIEIDMPDKMVEPCSSSSISFAQSLSSLLCFPRDKVEVGSLPISDCYAQSMAHSTQTLLWMANSFDRAKFLEADYKRLEQEKKDVDAAKSKADKDLEDLKQVLQTTQDKVDALELRNQTLGEWLGKRKRELTETKSKLQKATDAELDAEAKFYDEGLKDRLKRVRKVFGDRYKDCLLTDEEDPLSEDEHTNEGSLPPPPSDLPPSGTEGPEGDLRVFPEGLALAESVQDYVKNKPFGQRPISEKNLSWNYYVRVVEDTKARQKPWLEKWWTPTNDHKNERNEQNSSWDKLTVDRNLVLTACSSIKPCKRKLLILDVNGLLADFVSCEPDGYIADSKLGNTAVFKRPYCDDFLNFCFEKFHIGFWLTTSSKNARSNLNFILGRAAKDVLFAWDISQCFDTGYLERRNRNILFKELRIVWEKNEWYPWGREVFDQSNTLLVDNYPYTALLNPPHTGIFPPRYRYKDEITDDSLGPGGDLREFLEGLVLAENVQDYVKNNPFGQPPISDKHPSWNSYVRVIEDSKARQKPWLEKWWTPTNDHKKTC